MLKVLAESHIAGNSIIPLKLQLFVATILENKSYIQFQSCNLLVSSNQGILILTKKKYLDHVQLGTVKKANQMSFQFPISAV